MALKLFEVLNKYILFQHVLSFYVSSKFDLSYYTTDEKHQIPIVKIDHKILIILHTFKSSNKTTI